MDTRQTETAQPNQTGDEHVVIIGGGFYGCCLALFHHAQQGYRVTLLERSSELLTRASYNNQARVHQGYHYPRNVVTGLRCVANFARFVQDFGEAVDRSFTKLYAIARLNSKVTANQFWGFCQRVGAPIKPATAEAHALFDSDLVEDVFEVREYAFNAVKLREIILRQLSKTDIVVRYNSTVERITTGSNGTGLTVHLKDGEAVGADSVLSCVYSELNTLLRNSGLPQLPIKHEIAELALVEPPKILKPYGITLMDGPFFSLMPFPAENLFSLSHVRYTPHEGWHDATDPRDPYQYLADTTPVSNYTQMVRDATRYVPAVKSVQYRRSFYEVKTVLTVNERNDGRPILLQRNCGLPGLHVVLGGKIDNIYDIQEAIAPPSNSVTLPELPASQFGGLELS